MADTGQVWERFREPLYKFIKGKVPDENIAEDILQDVFLSIHKNLTRLREENKLQPWLYKIARNKIIDYYKKNRPEIYCWEEMEVAFEHDVKENHENMNPEISKCLEPIIDELPAKYRDVLFLYEFSNLTQKEVAAKLGLTLSAVKSRIIRGRKQLGEMLYNCCRLETDKFGNIVDFEERNNDYCNCS